MVLCFVKVRAQTALGQCRVLQGLLEDVENGVGCLPRSTERKAGVLRSGGLAKAADSTESDQSGESRLKGAVSAVMSMRRSWRPFDAPARRLPL